MMRKTVGSTLISALFMALIASNAIAVEPAATILVNGKILTVDSTFSQVESLAIRNGRIIATGDNKSTSHLIADSTKILDLKGKTVVPGLIDNHLHFIRGVWNFQTEARLDGITSREAAIAHLKQHIEDTEPGEWVTVMGGWISEQFVDDNKPFTLIELDELASENPLFLMRNYSEAFANSLAFGKLGMDNTDSARVAGRENVRKLVNAVSWRNKSSSEDAILKYMRELNRVGITTLYDVGRPSEGSLKPLELLATNQQLPLRVFHTLRYSARDAESISAALETIKGAKVTPRSHSHQFGLIGLGEHIYIPVSDSPRHTGLWDQEYWAPFAEISHAAAEHGWPVHEHVMSRDTARQYLDLVEQIEKVTPSVRDLRWTFAHVNGMQDEDIQRAADLGIALAVHSQARMSVRVFDAPRVGSIQRSGALWGLGSDAGIVAPYLPFNTLEWVVSGNNIAGDSAWSESQRVSREEALIAHTINNARMLFLEEHLGSLEVGKWADLLVLDRDYLTVDVEDISEISPEITMTSGTIVYSRN